MLNINFADGRINGFETMILQSEENADKVIRLFKDNYRPGDNPTELINEIIDKLGFTDSDLTVTSIRRIENTIENYVRYNYHGLY